MPNDSGSPPAVLIAFLTASLIASEVIVAPVTPSTLGLFCSTIFFGNSVIAVPAISGVSLLSLTSTFVIFPEEIVVLTVTFPLRPSTVSS